MHNNTQSLNPVTVVHDLTKAVNKRLHYVQITGECSFTGPLFGGNFVMAKVSVGLISVCLMELRGVCFLDV